MRVCVRVPEELPGPPFVLPNSYLAVCYGLPYITYDCTNSAEEFFFFQCVYVNRDSYDAIIVTFFTACVFLHPNIPCYYFLPNY